MKVKKMVEVEVDFEIFPEDVYCNRINSCRYLYTHDYYPSECRVWNEILGEGYERDTENYYAERCFKCLKTFGVENDNN